MATSTINDARDNNAPEQPMVDYFEVLLAVPSHLQQGDRLVPPLRFQAFENEKTLQLFGRYNETMDALEFVLSGDPGTAFKMSLSDGRSPYRWKVKRHGVVRQRRDTERDNSSYLSKTSEPDVFSQEDVLTAPMPLVRSADVGSEEEVAEATLTDCVAPWCFQGNNTLPRSFFRCRFQMLVYADNEEFFLTSSGISDGD